MTLFKRKHKNVLTSKNIFNCFTFNWRWLVKCEWLIANNRYPLYLEGKSTYRYQIPADSKKQETFNYRVKLPDGVTCTRCVIQWYYKTANSWGVCENGQGAMGCGPQETFQNCADVAIITNTAGFGPLGKVPTSTEDHPYAIRLTDKEQSKILVVRNQACMATGPYQQQLKSNGWCTANCLKYPPTCPPEACYC